ncbi:hypothetical protein J6590_069042 [Homalodisca vitripennis]|nr:hypothetical protein J6590_069042 [Homalodisca vitripennis]
MHEDGLKRGNSESIKMSSLHGEGEGSLSSSQGRGRLYDKAIPATTLPDQKSICKIPVTTLAGRRPGDFDQRGLSNKSNQTKIN